jgi:hypothetical protein
MYAINPVDNDFRIHDYYGIWFVADYFMDGIDHGEPLDPLLMIDQLNYHLSVTAPVKIKVSANIDADSVRATLKLIGVSPVLQTELRFRAAVIERMIQYSSPPGSNGETIFPDAMRKLLPDTSGFVIENINPGDEFTYNVSCTVNPEWNWKDLAVVAWLQSDSNRVIYFWQTTNHKIIQSGISLPTYIIQSDDPLAVFLLNNQNYSKNLKIINDNDVNLNLRLKVTEAQVPAGWSYTLTYNNVGIDSVDVSIAPGDSVVFGLNINTNSDPGIIRLALFAQNLDDPYNYGYTANCLGVTKTENSSVLFVDDDGGSSSEIAYYQALDSVGVCYTSIEKRLVPALKDQILAENFKAVFWNRCAGAPTFSYFDFNFLADYLESGGNLYMAISDGEFFSWWDTLGTYFSHNYLDAEYYGSFNSSSLFTGIEGTLGEGIITNLSSTPHLFIGSFSGVSDTIFQYAGITDLYSYGGLSYDAGTYKAVLLGVGLEQFTAASARQSLIQRVANWFEIPVGVSNEITNIPDQYNLGQNYPNPFNPFTKIRWQAPVSSWQTIKVYDILGNEIATLVNEERPAGTYEVIWYAEGLSSGVYFYQLKSENYIDTKKMILLH